MKIDDNVIIKFINNDLSNSEKKKFKLLIRNDQKIRARVVGIKNFKYILKKRSDIFKKTKMPNTLYKKISTHQNLKRNYVVNKFNNFYKIAAGIIVIFSISLFINIPDKTYLSQNPLSEINKNNHIHIFYDQKTLDEFLYTNSNCAEAEVIIDENNNEIFAVSCKK